MSFNRISTLGCWIVFIALAVGQSCYSDVIEEQFEIGDPFFFGVSGTDPGDQETTQNSFFSGPINDGLVRLRRPDTVLAGLSQLRFTAQSSGLSRIDFDLGDVTNTSLDRVLIGTRFELSEIDADADGDRFTFQVTADFVNGNSVTNVNDLLFSASDATLDVSVLDDGLFQVEVTNTSAASSSVSVSGANGKLIRQLSFANLEADVVNDELTSQAFRSLLAVPEPTGGYFLMAVGLILAFGTRRRSDRAGRYRTA